MAKYRASLILKGRIEISTLVEEENLALERAH